MACNRWIESPAGRLWLLSAVAVVYLLSYLGHPSLPGANPDHPEGWWGRVDQRLYLRCAESLAHGSLSARTYVYSLGYPALGALFYRFAPSHAFLLPNLFLVLGIAVLFYRIATRLISPVETVLGAILFIICYRGLFSATLVVPWNTIPTHALSYAIILLVGLRNPGANQIILAAGCVSLIYLCRSADAMCLAIPVGVALLRLSGFRTKLLAAAKVLGIWGLTGASVLLINHAVLNSWQTTYEQAAAAFGFGTFSFVQRAFLVMINGWPIFRERDTALLLHFPWLLLAVPGAIYLLRRYGLNALGAILSIAATYGVYLEYNGALWPINVFRYSLIHYLFWTLPLLALVTYVGLKKACRYPAGRWSLCSVPVLLFCTSFVTLREKVTREIPRPDSLETPIMLGPDAHRDWIEFKQCRTVPDLSVDGRALSEPHDFLSLPRFGEVVVWLSLNTRSQVIQVTPKNPEDVRSMRVGELRWRFDWLPKWVVRAAIENFGPPAATALGRSANIDFTGPLGIPDGQPDEVIKVTLRRWVLKRIGTWEIETESPPRHWISGANSQGWGQITPEVSNSPEIGERDSVVTLCFPDFGDFEKAPAFILRMLDSEGQTIFEQTVNK